MPKFQKKAIKKGVKKPAFAAAAKVQRIANAMSNMRTGGFIGRFKGPNREMKFFDTALSFSVDATGEVPATGQLALIPQGDTESSRDGRMAYVKSIQMRGTMLLNPGGAASAATVVYMYLVLDTQANGAAAAVTDVFTSATLNGALVNLANSQRFKILKKWVIDFNTGAGATTAFNQTAKHFELYKKLNVPVSYSSTTGAIGEIKSNNLFLIAGSINTDDLVTVTGVARLRFLD